MRIYHKKNFVSGLAMAGLGALNLAGGFWTGMDWGRVVLVALLLFFGGGLMVRACTRRMAREDIREERDERNRYVALRSQSQALRIGRNLCFALGVAFTLLELALRDDRCLHVAIGLYFAYGILLLTELFTYAYYEERC